MNTSEQGRQDRILEAAEDAFAEFGFAGASLRDIVLRAGVNLATVYYYFRSKHGLIEAVLKRRFDPLRQENLELLRQFEAAAGDQPVLVEKVLEAMLRPPLRLAIRPSAKGAAVTRLVGRLVTEPDPEIQALLRSQHAEVQTVFLNALQRSLPGIPFTDLRWRLEFVWGALAIILCNPRKLEQETHGACNPVDAERVLAEMIRFFAPGFRAPAVQGRRAPTGCGQPAGAAGGPADLAAARPRPAKARARRKSPVRV